MGQQTSFQLNFPQITDRSISYISELSSRRSTMSNLRATKTITVGTIQELNLLKQTFHFRLKNRDYLSHWYGFEVLQFDQENSFSKFSCKSVFTSLKVNFHYEKNTDNFSSLYQISVQHGLKLLGHCLRGFSLLYDNFGYFTPESRHINKQGDGWRVWINQNIFTLKSKSKKQSSQKQISKQKFLQQVVHLFDVLRDDSEPEFSYSVFVYGKVKNSQFFPCLQLGQILGLLNQPIQNQKSVKNHRHRASLKRLSLQSSETVGRVEFNTLVSSDDKGNESTRSKFMKNSKTLNKSFNESNRFQKSQKENVKKDNLNIQCQNCYQSFQSYHGYGQAIQLNHFGETNPQKHTKNRSSVSTSSNCTGWTKNMSPLKMFQDRQKRETLGNQDSFVKKERSYTMDLTNQGDIKLNDEILQMPIKITEDSEINSESDEIDFGKKKFDQAFLPSQQSLRKQESEQIGSIKKISKDPTSNKTPSIAYKTGKYGKQTMKLLKEYLLYHSKGEHKRSLTDPQNKIKYCWSQEFDSEFVSVGSKHELVSENTNMTEYPDHMQQKSHEDENCYEDQNRNEEFRQHQKKKSKQVKIADEESISVYSYQKESDRVCQKSNIRQQSHKSYEVSIEKLPNFKSEGGFQSLLKNKRLNTIKSIKQIDVDYTIDQDILVDLNKMLNTHQFAKSSKLTHL